VCSSDLERVEIAASSWSFLLDILNVRNPVSLAAS
jgi:hypothetical protein